MKGALLLAPSEHGVVIPLFRLGDSSLRLGAAAFCLYIAAFRLSPAAFNLGEAPVCLSDVSVCLSDAPVCLNGVSICLNGASFCLIDPAFRLAAARCRRDNLSISILRFGSLNSVARTLCFDSQQSGFPCRRVSYQLRQSDFARILL